MRRAGLGAAQAGIAGERLARNGSLVEWADAKIHIASHVIHYGSAVFEGARCYSTPKGPACFRLEDHMRRLYDSARIYRMAYELDQEALTNAVIDTIKANKFDACYIRPLIYRGYDSLGVNPLPCPVAARDCCFGPRRDPVWSCWATGAAGRLSPRRR